VQRLRSKHDFKKKKSKSKIPVGFATLLTPTRNAIIHFNCHGSLNHISRKLIRQVAKRSYHIRIQLNGLPHVDATGATLLTVAREQQEKLFFSKRHCLATLQTVEPVGETYIEANNFYNADLGANIKLQTWQFCKMET